MTDLNQKPGGDFSPRSVYFQLLRRWWWSAVCILLGAMAGWGFSRFVPPLYEARSTFSFNIDYSQTGLLTDVQEDQALEAAGDLLKSTEVKTLTQTALSSNGLQLSDADIKKSVIIERRNNAWLVIIRRSNPTEAGDIAAAWGDSFDKVYSEAYRHAISADGLQRYLKSLENCLQETAAVDPVQPVCQPGGLESIQAELSRTGNAISQERKAAKNLFAGMLYEWSGRAELLPAAVRFDSGRFILFGALVGFIISLWLIQVRPFKTDLSSDPAGAR